MPNSSENEADIRLRYCKKCERPIDGATNTLCDYMRCEFDGIHISERPADTVEERIYGYLRTEPYVPNQAD